MKQKTTKKLKKAFLGTFLACLAIPTAYANDVTVTIATVDNSDMIRMKTLSDEFTKANPDIALKWVTLSENELRQKVTTDIATKGGKYDILTIGTYEVPIWAKREWLLPLNDMPSSYDIADILPPIRSSLSIDDMLYAAPFYGESSFTMYRKDLLEKAGMEIPAEPTWDHIQQVASKIHDPSNGVYGICLRGKPGWGENMALITSMANAYGARWFDTKWAPQLNSPQWQSATSDYVDLLTKYGPPDAVENGYTENLALFQKGNCGIWIDATVAASSITDPEKSEVADTVGFALAPDTGLGKRSNWIWAWSLAIPKYTGHKEAAKRFVAWATSKEYTTLVAEKYGWLNAPPGTRRSLYDEQAYLDAAPFAQITLASIMSADPGKPTVDEVPYTGIQYVARPEFQGIGTAVGQQLANAVSGALTPEKALSNAQWVTEKVVKRALFLE